MTASPLLFIDIWLLVKPKYLQRSLILKFFSLSCLEKATLDEAIVNASYGRQFKSIIISVGWIKVHLETANTNKNAFKMNPFVGILIVVFFLQSCEVSRDHDRGQKTTQDITGKNYLVKVFEYLSSLLRDNFVSIDHINGRKN